MTVVREAERAHWADGCPILARPPARYFAVGPAGFLPVCPMCGPLGRPELTAASAEDVTEAHILDVHVPALGPVT